ncbi:hypothetical protein JOM56_005040 [Amanita muscaria]
MSYSMNVPFVIALFVQTLMYGLYVTTLVHCLRWLFYDDKGWKLREKINWAMATITVLVFMFFTIDLALTLQITIDSLENWGKPLLDRINVVTIMIENITILIVDAVLSMVDHVLLKTVPSNGFLAAIIYRILRAAKETGRPSRRLHNTCRILGESGILYTISSILNLSASMLDITPKYFVLKVVVDTIALTNFSMTGITFNLILIRVGQGRATEETHLNSQDTLKQPTLSTLRFHVPATQSMSISLVDAERGAHAKTKSRHEAHMN